MGKTHVPLQAEPSRTSLTEYYGIRGIPKGQAPFGGGLGGPPNKNLRGGWDQPTFALRKPSASATLTQTTSRHPLGQLAAGASHPPRPLGRRSGGTPALTTSASAPFSPQRYIREKTEVSSPGEFEGAAPPRQSSLWGGQGGTNQHSPFASHAGATLTQTTPVPPAVRPSQTQRQRHPHQTTPRRPPGQLPADAVRCQRVPPACQ